MSTYSENLSDPRWQRKRNGILDRDNYTCQHCGRTQGPIQLEVHHIEYFSELLPWEYSDDMLITVCRQHHVSEQARFKHEQYLLRSLKMNGFLADDILALSIMISNEPGTKKYLLQKIREFSKQL